MLLMHFCNYGVAPFSVTSMACCRCQLQLRVLLQRLAYFPQEAAKELSKFSLVVAIDARLPVAMFGYK